MCETWAFLSAHVQHEESIYLLRGTEYTANEVNVSRKQSS